jgi:alpha-L-rhamnosidase
MYGKISSSWKVENGQLTYEAVVPANTTATLYLPASSVETIKENGKALKKVKGITLREFSNGKAVFELESGSYKFVSEL